MGAEFPDKSKIMEEDAEYIMHSYARFPVVIRSGSGALITDADGKEYLRSLGVPYRETPFENVFSASGFVRNADYDKGIYYHVLRRHNEVNRSNCFTKRDYRSWNMESNRYSIWSITYIFRVQI